MALLPTWFYNLRQPQTLTESLRSYFYGSTGGVTESVVLTPEQAMQISAVYTCVNLISKRIAATEFRLMEITTKGSNGKVFKSENATHWAAKLMARPNPMQGMRAFIRQLATNAQLSEGALIWISRDVPGRPVHMYVVPMGIWTRNVDKNGNAVFLVNTNDSKIKQTTLVEGWDAVLIGGPVMTGNLPMSPLVAMRDVLGIHSALVRSQQAFAQNTGMPRGIISTPIPIDDEEAREALLAEIKRKFTPGESGIMLLDGDTKFTPLSATFSDSKFLEQREAISKEIAGMYNVPPTFLGFGSVTAEDERTLSIDAVRDWILTIEEFLNVHILGNESGFRFDADEHAHMRSDPIKQMDFLSKAIGAGGHQGILSQNEARTFLGWNPIDDPAYDVVSQGAMQTAPIAPASDGIIKE